MRAFEVKIFQNVVECFEVEEVRRVDYTARRKGGEVLLYQVIVSHKRGQVRFGRDRGSSYCHYHAKNISDGYKFEVTEKSS